MLLSKHFDSSEEIASLYLSAVAEVEFVQNEVIMMTETSCHQSNSPIAILIERSIISSPDRMASVSQMFRFALLLNIVVYI